MKKIGISEKQEEFEMKMNKLAALILAGTMTFSCTAATAITVAAATEDVQSSAEEIAVNILEMFDEQAIEDILGNPDKVADLVIQVKNIVQNMNPSEEEIKNVLMTALNQYSDLIGQYSDIQITEGDVDAIAKAIRYALDLNLSDDQIREYVKEIYSTLNALGIDPSDAQGAYDKVKDLFGNLF